jgi:hypothetical protein
MNARVLALVAVGLLLSSCGIPPFARSTPAGDWTVVTDPFALAGRPVTIIFRFREGQARPATDFFAFSAICTTCSDPKPVVTGSAMRDRRASDVIYSGTVTFPSAGTWWTSPYVGPLEVR